MELANGQSARRCRQPSAAPLYHHLALTVYWLSNSLLWGALLHLGLQSRLSDWFGPRPGRLLPRHPRRRRRHRRHGHPDHRRRLQRPLAAPDGAAAALPASPASCWPSARWSCWGPPRLLGPSPAPWSSCSSSPTSPSARSPPCCPTPSTRREHGKASGFMGVARLLGDVGGLMLAGLLLSTGTLGETAPRPPHRLPRPAFPAHVPADGRLHAGDHDRLRARDQGEAAAPAPAALPWQTVVAVLRRGRARQPGLLLAVPLPGRHQPRLLHVPGGAVLLRQVQPAARRTPSRPR